MQNLRCHLHWQSVYQEVYIKTRMITSGFHFTFFANYEGGQALKGEYL